MHSPAVIGVLISAARRAAGAGASACAVSARRRGGDDYCRLVPRSRPSPREWDRWKACVRQLAEDRPRPRRCLPGRLVLQARSGEPPVSIYATPRHGLGIQGGYQLTRPAWTALPPGRTTLRACLNERMMTAQPAVASRLIVYTAHSIPRWYTAGVALISDPSGGGPGCVCDTNRRGAHCICPRVCSWLAFQADEGTVDSVDYGSTWETPSMRPASGRSWPNEPELGPTHLLRPLRHDRTRVGPGVQPRTLSSERSDRRVGKPVPSPRSRCCGPTAAGAGGRGGFLRGQGPVHHRRILE